jgi:hypothetical protein
MARGPEPLCTHLKNRVCFSVLPGFETRCYASPVKKILIVDDEFLVRLGLKTTIDWEKYGYVIAGEANNGKEALEINKKIGPT